MIRCRELSWFLRIIDRRRMRTFLPAPRSALGLATFGATAGPLVDAVHNQALLQYDVLPVSIDALNAHTSLLIPPLLALTYLLLGGVLPRVSELIVGNGRALPASSIPLGLTAMLAVTSTVAIIKASELLFSALDSGAGVALLLLACLAQWALLDGAWASLALALCVAVGGPVAEEPFLYSGCWHYLQPDYFPLGVEQAWSGLNYITGPCYFAVTTDAIALGRWLSSINLSDATTNKVEG